MCSIPSYVVRAAYHHKCTDHLMNICCRCPFVADSRKVLVHLHILGHGCHPWSCWTPSSRISIPTESRAQYVSRIDHTVDVHHKGTHSLRFVISLSLLEYTMASFSRCTNCTIALFFSSDAFASCSSALCKSIANLGFGFKDPGPTQDTF